MGDVRQNEHLIIQTAFVGDLLLSIPLLKELRRLKPGDRLVLLCRKGLGSFLKRAGLIDEVVEFDKSNAVAGAGAAAGAGSTAGSGTSWAAVKTLLKRRSFDLVICPHESPRSRLLVFSLKAKRKIGYAGFMNFLIFNDQVVRPMELPEAIRQLALLQPLDSSWAPRLAEFRSQQELPGGVTESGLVAVPTWASMELPALVELRSAFRSGASIESLEKFGASDKWISLINELNLQSSDRIAFLAPGSVWPTKMWTHSGYAEAARALLQDGFRVLLTGAPNEVEICNAIVRDVPGVVSIAGRTDLYESAQILSLADLLICNDSGAMHMAAAAGVPTVSIFGPTVLKFGYRPWQNLARVESVNLSCRPCGKHGATQCPIGTHDCMKKVGAQQVLNSARDLLEHSSR